VTVAGTCCVVALALSVAFATPGRTQSPSRTLGAHLEGEAERFVFSLDFVASLAADFHVLSWKCQIGDPEAWTRVIDAVDRRYRRCAPIGSALEQAVARGFASQWHQALVIGASRDAGTLAWEKWLPVKSGWHRGTDCAKVRSLPTMRLALDPGSATAEERAAVYAASEAAVRVDRDNLWTMPTFDAIRALGVDQTWVDAPCDPFFPQLLTGK
jgi:hypothetical protein